MSFIPEHIEVVFTIPLYQKPTTIFNAINQSYKQLY